MEFQLINPQTFVKVIEFNYDELEKWITEQVEQFQNLTYTDDTIKNAKEDRAKLNKFKENIDNARKDVKKRYLEPYNSFEEKVKTLLKLIEEPTKAIDVQVKSYEQNKKEVKKIEIENYYNATVGDLSKLISLDNIFDNKWLNATVSIKNIQSEIDKIFEKIKFDLQTIKDLKSEWELTLIDNYLNTFDISAALREKTRLEERKRDLAFQRDNAIEPTTEEVEVKEEPNTEANKMVEAEPEKTYVRKFWVKGTANKLRALGEYMKANGIEYGGLE